MIEVLLADADAALRRSVTACLERFGMRVTVLDDGRALEQRLSAGAGGSAAGLDVLLLDPTLPRANGLDLCRHARWRCALPVILLDASGNAMDRIVGLEIGADDVLPKPFEPRELAARIHALLRRIGVARASGSAAAAAGSGHRSSFAGWSFDRTLRRLTSPDRSTTSMLSSAECRLLCAFLDHPRRVLSRECLLDLSHAAGADITDRAIDLAVSRLRQRLGPAASLIRTLRGEGYVFEPEAAR